MRKGRKKESLLHRENCLRSMDRDHHSGPEGNPLDPEGPPLGGSRLGSIGRGRYYSPEGKPPGSEGPPLGGSHLSSIGRGRHSRPVGKPPGLDAPQLAFYVIHAKSI